MMKTVRILSFVFAGMFLASCAPTQLLRGLGLRTEDKVEPFSCPLAFTPDYYRLLLSSSQGIPAKVAIKLDGKLKYDECLSSPVIKDAPMATMRKNDSNNLEVAFQWFPEPKPTSMSLEILDRGDCSAAPVSFFVANDIPVTFETHFYNEHHECGSYQAGETKLSQ